MSGILTVLAFLAAIVLKYTDASTGRELVSVVVLYRHGDRAPLAPYKNDPYDESYWPLGFGQLTNIGKIQQYGLGRWLRSRYKDFLPETYSRKDIKIYSSNIDRCLMSAELNVAGLYPPQGDQVWNEELRWQPIPIHTVPEKEDAILAQQRPCPKYTKLYEELMQEEHFKNLMETNKKLSSYFSEQSGENITTFEELLDLYNTVYIEHLHGLALPEWTKSLLTDEMEKFCMEAWTTYAYTQDLARLRSGPLINLILNHFEDVRNNVKDTPKLLMLSAHDSTIAPLLTSMKVFNYEWPNYASSVLFELSECEGGESVNIFYKNSDEVANLTLPGCDFDCDFDDFQQILAPLRIDLYQWDQECQKL